MTDHGYPLKQRTALLAADRMRAARELSWRTLGKKVDFFFPGMFRVDGRKGCHRALSITGDRCDLQCEHCRGRLLASMIPVPTPERLIRECTGLASRGIRSVLLSGGCDRSGRMPWERFEEALRRVKEKTGLFVSAHAGLADSRTARVLRRAGVDQVLIDVVGDQETLREICRLEAGPEHVLHSLQALRDEGLSVAPHVICGLHRGMIRGEKRALEMIARSEVNPETVVFCSLMRLPGTPSWTWPEPDVAEVGRLMAEARFLLPRVLQSLGCARKRGDRRLERFALEAGFNRMALPGDETVEYALGLGLDVVLHESCCSASSVVLSKVRSAAERRAACVF